MMASSIFSLLLSSFLLCTFLHHQPTHAIKKSYVVYLGSHSHGPDPSPADMDSATNSHHDLLASVLGSREKAKKAMFYSYNKHINGFAALLEEEEAEEIKKIPEVVSVFVSKMHKLHTTRSWEFLGLENKGRIRGDSAWNKGSFGQNTIIANIDSGVWPESKSFSDKGHGPIPARWRGGGVCQIDNLPGSNGTLCNRKLIGARVFHAGYEAEVGKILPSRRTARDFDGHGTHTLSTAGGNFVRGVSVLNNGNGTAKGGSPRARVVAYKVCWSLMREDGGCMDADILSAFDHAISDGVDVLSVSVGEHTYFTKDLLTDGISIGAYHAVAKGIVVVCSTGNQGPDLGTVKNVAPWVLTVAASSIDRDFRATSTTSRNGSTFVLKAKTFLGIRPAPVMAAFSSRGPNPIHPELLKPDVTAPGLNIIAAYALDVSPTGISSDRRRLPFNILSGTSMACPHVAGIAGILKTRHPKWSPAAIKSAIMTTATILDNTNNRIRDGFNEQLATPFAYGSGHVQPNLAIDPGLVYDLEPFDYLNILCGFGYEERQVATFNYNKPHKCPRFYKIRDFNYPSITVTYLGTTPIVVTRIVTNVGPASTYNVMIQEPMGVKVVVQPNTLNFMKTGEKNTFRVVLQATELFERANFSFGELSWTDGKHKVRSPIVVLRNQK